MNMCPWHAFEVTLQPKRSSRFMKKVTVQYGYKKWITQA